MTIIVFVKKLKYLLNDFLHCISFIIFIIYLQSEVEQPGSMFPSAVLTWRNNSIDIENSSIFFEKRRLCTTPDGLSSVATMFATYHVFNVAYPHELINTLSFLDAHVLGIEKTMYISTCVQKVINMLHS